MARSKTEQPTELELEILRVLWDKSPLLVRDVRAALEETGRPLAHSTVITMLNIMHRKGFLKRRRDGKSFWFWPAVPKDATTGKMVGSLLSRLFNGSPAAMDRCYRRNHRRGHPKFPPRLSMQMPAEAPNAHLSLLYPSWNLPNCYGGSQIPTTASDWSHPLPQETEQN